ncbi:MAG: dTMP kinase [Ktedonobacteraceae bacterium]
MGKTRGLFITFDGPNGVGKSSIILCVAALLTQSGCHILTTKEPTFSSLGQFVRDAEEVYTGRTFAHLVAADRYFHISSEILPALSAGKIILCDRYVESSLALQRLDGLKIDEIWSINSLVQIPDLSIILQAQPKILAQRLAQRNRLSRFEKNNSRIQELTFYQEAASFLSCKGFNIMFLENNNVPLEQIAQKIAQKILTIEGDHVT